MVRFAIAGLAVVSVCDGCGCGHQKPFAPTPTKTHPTAPPDPWKLTCVDPNDDTPALLWNGEIGIRLDRTASGIDENDPLFSIDEYDVSGEEKIRKLFNPVGLDLSPNLAPDPAQPYRQSLDMKTGILTTRWSAASGASISVETVLHPSRRVVAEKWSFKMSPGAPFSLMTYCTDTGTLPDTRDPRHAVWRLNPSGMLLTVDQTCSAENSTWQYTRSGARIKGTANADGEFEVVRVLQFMPSPNEVRMLQARRLANTSGGASPSDLHATEGRPQLARLDAPTTFASIESESKRIWGRRWQTDIQIDGPVRDQQAVRSFLFYLRSAAAPGGRMAISPFGLSSDLYGGHVFWDADIWVFPALALVSPDEAKVIPAYRLALQGTARKNFNQWLEDGRPTAAGKLGPYSGGKTPLGYKYPWESSVTGQETVPGPSRFEDHINGDVAWMLEQAAELGLCPANEAQQVVTGLGTFWRLRASGKNIDDVMSPDENHTGNNDLYTNLLAQWCVNAGHWNSSNPDFTLPYDKTSFLTYDQDPLKGYKQAAAVLSIYPLQYPPAEKQDRAMMKRFADKVIANGPAMTDSVHALIQARMGATDKAYSTWQESWRPFTANPLMLFSEKRNRPRTYFTTGAAGSLQSVIYGFMGFRIDSRKQDGALWSANLALGRILSVRPNLPKTWKSVKFTNFTVNGRRYTLTASHSGTESQCRVRVTQGDR